LNNPLNHNTKLRTWTNSLQYQYKVQERFIFLGWTAVSGHSVVYTQRGITRQSFAWTVSSGCYCQTFTLKGYVSPWESCGGKSGCRTDFSLSTSVFPLSAGAHLWGGEGAGCHAAGLTNPQNRHLKKHRCFVWYYEIKFLHDLPINRNQPLKWSDD
jgi:hypothetical protein